MQDMSEFFSWQAYGLKEVNKKWKAIMKKVSLASEKNYKLAILEADDFLFEEMQDAEFKGGTFEEMAENAGKRVMTNWQDVLEAHKVRNLIVHETNYKLDLVQAKKILDDYNKAIKSIYSY